MKPRRYVASAPRLPVVSTNGTQRSCEFARFAARASAIALLLGLALGGAPAAQAQTAADISAAAGKICAVISGQEKADSRTLQYLLLLDEDMADANPVAIALYHDVVQSCPKAYIAYEQRLHSQNPFANGGLVKSTPTNLTGSSTSLTGTPSPEYPIRCRGAQGMAKANGTVLVVTFAKAPGAASQGLQGGQCAWIDRAVRASEPATINVPLANAGDVGRGVAQINAGGLWTFWVVNAGTSLRATAVAKGTPAKKP
jgi:hypothetical protein